MSTPRLEELLTRLAGASVVVVGDVMLDEYVWGDVGRISPDAPVQVVDIRRRSHAVGGAANVAHNIRAAGGEVFLAGVVGDDAAGGTLMAMLTAAGIDAAGLIVVPGRPTTVKTRVMARGQQIVRLDSEDRSPLASGVRASLLAQVARTLPRCGAVLVSDYAKGVVDRGLVGEIAKHRAPGSRALLLVDPKDADFGVYRGCDLITPNRKEAEAATGLSLGADAELSAATQRIRAACGAPHVLVTLGERGLALGSPDGTVEVIPAQAREVYDVTGAGDTVLAYLGIALAVGAAPGDAARLANLAAGVAVAKLGTSAVGPAEVAAALTGARGAAAKSVGVHAAVAKIEHERSLGRRIVFTNGCFDLLHAGHVHLLERARALGDVLVVGVNSDASVRRLKGPDRPLVAEDDRVQGRQDLHAVDLVIVFDEDTPLELIRQIRPDVLAKGGDYTVATIVGADLVLGAGGRVETIPLVAGRSTSQLVEQILKSKDD